MKWIWLLVHMGLAQAGVTPWFADPNAACERALGDRIDGRAKNLNYDPISFDGKKGVRVPAFSSINRANIEYIFRHQYDRSNPGKFGAKAVAAKTLLGIRVVWFFPTGEGFTGSNVHHRDALSAIVQHYGKMGYDWISSVHKFASEHFERHPELAPPLDADFSLLDAYVVIQDGLDLMGDAYEHGGGSIKARGMNEELARDSLLVHWISEAQGYQLTAERVNGELQVTEVNIDSAITNFQIHHQIELDAKLQTELYDLVIRSIGKKVRNFKLPSWPSELNLTDREP